MVRDSDAIETPNVLSLRFSVYIKFTEELNATRLDSRATLQLLHATTATKKRFYGTLLDYQISLWVERAPDQIIRQWKQFESCWIIEITRLSRRLCNWGHRIRLKSIKKVWWIAICTQNRLMTWNDILSTQQSMKIRRKSLYEIEFNIFTFDVDQ